mgnify:CR=1 FL=1
MRRWLLVTLVLLLTVRGWVGDAMAGEMLATRLAAASEGTAVVAQHGAHNEASTTAAEPDCHGVMPVALPPAADDPADAQPAASHADCPTCSACQICSAVGVLLPNAPRLPAALAQPVPVARLAVITSIAPVALFKPPIS